MTEDEARGWIIERFGIVATERIEQFLVMVTTENDYQNLIAPSTIATIWQRHALDSAQLVDMADGAGGAWGDVGSGGGFPGMIVGLLHSAPVMLIEPRRKRAEFLSRAAGALGLKHVTVEACRVEQVAAAFTVISARAVASVEKLLHAARHCATTDTRWLLPRGRIEPATLEWLRQRRAVFHVKQSLSDPSSGILVIEGCP